MRDVSRRPRRRGKPEAAQKTHDEFRPLFSLPREIVSANSAHGATFELATARVVASKFEYNYPKKCTALVLYTFAPEPVDPHRADMGRIEAPAVLGAVE